jgi:hypothetical protein
MGRSFPGWRRLILAVTLAGFWLAALLVVALVASWSTNTVMMLAIGHAAALAVILGLIWEARLRTRAAAVSGKHRARPSRSGFGVSSPATTRGSQLGVIRTAVEPPRATHSHGR